MKNLRILAASMVLTLGFALPVFAGQIPTMPAPPPPPGEMQGPGFASTTPGQTDTPPEANASFTDFAISVLESLLPLF